MERMRVEGMIRRRLGFGYIRGGIEGHRTTRSTRWNQDYHHQSISSFNQNKSRTIIDRHHPLHLKSSYIITPSSPRPSGSYYHPQILLGGSLTSIDHQPRKLFRHSIHSSNPDHPPIKTHTTNTGDDHQRLRKENIYTLPNLLTLTRIILCPALSWTIVHDDHLTSTILLSYCALSDWVDGKLARSYPDRMASILGTILDPAADKILMTTLVLSLSYKSLVPLPLAVIIIGRDLLLSLSAFYFRYQSLPAPKTFTRFWDFSLPSAQVKPSLISKYNTFLQLALVGLTTVTPILPIDTTMPMFLLQWTVAGTTIWSGVSYVFSRDAIRYIR